MSLLLLGCVWVYLYNALGCSKHHQSIVEKNSESVHVSTLITVDSGMSLLYKNMINYHNSITLC